MFKAKCPAKINLFLKLLGKRPDGYHKLESLFAFLDLSDELTVILQTEILKQVQDDEAIILLRHPTNLNHSTTLNHPTTLRHPELVSGSHPIIEITGEYAKHIDPTNNLFTKILDFFATHYKVTKNLHIKITKNIPVGAGLGGGSSNAAFFMKALNELFSLNLTKEQLQKISLNFGSDIAFFFEDQASIVKGRGELIEKFPKFKPILTLLINPKINLSTKDVFNKFNKIYSTEISNDALQKEEVLKLIKTLPNDLTKPASAVEPIIKEILHEMENEGANIAKMSGSGSTCFAIFNNENQLILAKNNLTKKFPNFLIRKTKILSNVL